MPDTRAWQRLKCIARFALGGATLGLVVGLLEATHLRSTPRIYVLLKPDVRYVIWFLAPLADLLFFGVLGLVLGVLAATPQGAPPKKRAMLAAAGLGISGAYVSMALNLTHFAAKVYNLSHLWRPLISFSVVLSSVLLVFVIWRRRISRYVDAESAWAFRPLATILSLAMVIALAGMGFYLARRSIPLHPAMAGLPQSSHGHNIVLIVLDTVRADHLSVYGYPRITTPNLDRLAGQGVLFENAVAPSSWTLPSLGTIFTGLLPHQHGVNWIVPLSRGSGTLAEILRSHGYETAGFNSNFDFGQDGWGVGQGFEMYEDDSSSLRHNFGATVAGRLAQHLYQNLVRYEAFERRNAREVNRDVIRWFHHRSDRPFFLFINYFDAHEPYLLAGASKDGPRLPDELVRNLSQTGGSFDHMPISAEEKASLIDGYDNCLKFLDEQVGELFKFLATSPRWSDTIVIITADHGESFGEHGTYSHGWNLYREVLHVPLIFFGPGIPSGRRLKHVVGNRETFSTVLELALGAYPEGALFRPYSLRRFWSMEHLSAASDEVVMSELAPVPTRADQTVLISLMTPEWHYVRGSNGQGELYHWADDFDEKVNLAYASEFQSVLQSLAERLYRRVQFSRQPWRGPKYLSALDWPGHSFLREIGFAPQTGSNGTRTQGGPGTSQAFSVPDHPSPPDAELIESLPYH